MTRPFPTTSPGNTVPTPGAPLAVPTGRAGEPPRPTCTTAVIALVAAFLAPIVGLVLGVVARRRIARSRENGRGLATAAIVLGALFSLAWTVAIVVVIAFGSFTASFSTAPSVPATSLQTEIETRAGLPAGSVSCPDALPATVGATTTCSGALDGRPTPVVVTVTTVDGTDVGFDFTSR